MRKSFASWVPISLERLSRLRGHATRGARAALSLLCVLLAFAHPAAAQTSNTAAPDAICGNCHQRIYDSYERTPMARASGDAVEGLLPGTFLHKISGIEYRIFLRGNQAWLAYDRPGATGVEALHGEQQLIYYIGSGNRGRTYIFQRDGFWFESPVNWYSKKKLWDMNPKSLDAKEMPFTLPVDSTCLHCHSSGTTASLPGGRNHFAGAPFAHGGVPCASCHGSAAAHIAQNGRAPILNPASLTGSRRDSICLQCHLEGEIAVNQPGRSLSSFHPGDDLADDVHFFVHGGETGADGRATSQWEALLESACYRKSAGKMTCTTCHDPHHVPTAEERVAYYRGKCLACHANPGFVARHHLQQQDCTSCHMAREKTEDIAHEQVTDHFIQKRPSAWLEEATPHDEKLIAVGSEAADNRDLGLAYAQMAIKGDSGSVVQGKYLLQQVEAQEQNSGTMTHDAELHAKLGFLDLLSNDMPAASREYEAALAFDPRNSVAAGDLAVIKARSHQLAAAVQLWRMAADEDPGQTGAGFDLAVGACMLGDSRSAIDALKRVIAFSPDDAKAKKLLAEIEDRPELCSPAEKPR